MGKTNLKKIGQQALTGGKNVGKVALATAFGAAALECTFFGLRVAEADARVVAKEVKYKFDPDVYKVKKGFFGKTKNVNISPMTGRVSADKTGKKPVNKKAIIIK